MAIETVLASRIYNPNPQIHVRRLRSTTIIHSKGCNLFRRVCPQLPFIHRSLPILCQSQSDASSRSGSSGKAIDDDYVTRILKENPSQVETRYLIGGKFYTLKEKQNLSDNSDVGVLQLLAKKLNLVAKSKNERGEAGNGSGLKNDAVYLNDILREYRGKLYVPEQIFGTQLPEEEEFQRNFDELPKMSLEDFQKAMKCDKVRLLTSKEVTPGSYGNGYRDFIVDLKEIPGDKSLQRTKWYLMKFQTILFFQRYAFPWIFI